MRWLITGGGGFIGSALVQSICAVKGTRVRVVDNFSVSSIDDFRERFSVNGLRVCQADRMFRSQSTERIDLVLGDIRDQNLAELAAVDCDVIVHLAANTGVQPSIKDPRNDCMTNVLGTLNYLEAAKIHGIKRFVFASSSALLGDAEPPFHENLLPQPVSPYGSSKLSGEGYCSAYCRTFGIETTMLRFSNVYGPGSTYKQSVVAKFIRSALRNGSIEVFGDGRQTRDFIYIDDLVRAIYVAGTLPGLRGEVFQIGSSRESTVLEVAETLCAVLRRRGFGDLEVLHGDPLAGDVRRSCLDTTKARRMLGWRPEIELEEGLSRTLDWFVHQGSAWRPGPFVDGSATLSSRRAIIQPALKSI